MNDWFPQHINNQLGVSLETFHLQHFNLETRYYNSTLFHAAPQKKDSFSLPQPSLLTWPLLPAQRPPSPSSGLSRSPPASPPPALGVTGLSGSSATWQLGRLPCALACGVDADPAAWLHPLPHPHLTAWTHFCAHLAPGRTWPHGQRHSSGPPPLSLLETIA